MKIRHYVIIGVASYLLFLIANIPAATALGWAGKEQLPFQAYGVNGTVWRGSADTVLAQNQRLDDITWNIHPLSLLVARLNADVQARIFGETALSEVSVNLLTSSVEAENLRLQLPAKTLQKQLKLPMGELDGDFNMRIDTLLWEPQVLLPAIEGVVNWRDARFTLAIPVELGQVNLELTNGEDGKLNGIVNNDGGKVRISGTIEINEQGLYQLQATLKPNADAPPQIAETLKMFARSNRNGEFEFSQQGDINKLY